ncbi:hypothetical protein [Clostridium sp. C8-1-8]|uniref:hypothetical protein n=1 Tax=Clostridium sp. C8-1-8 TaxID=2698831 RepID=UPI00136B10E9|nr:hypothetical protein [Clostridium sp. C8-1-8]
MMNTNILQLEAKDILTGVTIKKGNYKRYKATLDYSLDSDEIDFISSRKNEFYQVDNKQYCDSVISVTFKYSVKDEDGKTTVKTNALREELYANGFDITFSTDKKSSKIHFVRYKRSSGSSRVGKCLFIREDLYEKAIKWSFMNLNINEGDEVDLAALEAYIALTTSAIIDTISGISKENILVIDEYNSVFDDTVMATRVINKDGVDRLQTREEKVEISNNIWDGQCLLSAEIFKEKYADKGMLLLRNRYYKAACFNTNIQKFFEDAGITEVSQLNGFTLAKDIKQIKMICTKSCIKYSKFSSVEKWLKELEDKWGVVKYEKPTHYFGGRYVQTHYQLLQTINFDREEMLELLKPSVDYLDKILNDTRVMRNHLKMKIDEDLDMGDISTTNSFMLNMLQLNDKFSKTKMYSDFRTDIRESFIKNIRKGHVLIEGTYAVLFGNGMEMLKATIKDKSNEFYFTGNSILSKGEIHCSNFAYETEILGCRSPHVTMGNLLLAKNVACKAIDKYFNLSKQIVCVNSIKDNILERLSSADFDSDQMLLTADRQIIDEVKENYNKFLVPTSFVKAKKVPRYYTAKDKADLDIKTSVNKIGEIINLSQQLNTILWDKVNNGADINSKEIQDLYADIAQLDILSCIEIDKAKKEFSIDSVLELEELRNKYKITVLYNAQGKEATMKEIRLFNEMVALKEDEQDYKYFEKENGLEGYYTKNVKPYFMQFTGSKKKQKEMSEANKNVEFIKYKTSMDFLEDIVDKEFKNIKAQRENNILTFTEIFQTETKILTSKCDKDRVKRILEINKEYKAKIKNIWGKDIAEGATEDEIKEINTKKYKDSLNTKNECIKEIAKLKVKAEDIKRIIKDLDEETKAIVKERNENKKASGKVVDETKKYEIFAIGRFLLTVLYNAHRAEFLKIFEEQKESLEVLQYIGKNDDIEKLDTIKLYNTYFKIIKK